MKPLRNINILVTLCALLAGLLSAPAKPAGDPPEITITQEPADVNLTEGDTLNLSVKATGPDPLTYQWHYRAPGAAEAFALEGKNDSILIIPNVELSHQGTYSVVISDNVQSRDAKVNVAKKTVPLRITKQPVGVTIDEGAQLSLEVQAQGEAPLTFQWYYGTSSSVPPSSVLSGQTSTIFTLAAAQPANAGYYLVRVTDRSGNLDSDVVQVTVKPKTPNPGIVADSGFRPEKDGFSFENYGNNWKPLNLTATEIRRMFGDQACATINGDVCILTPPGQKWMEKQSAEMNGGHCEGMAVLSLLLHSKKVDVQRFGANTTFALDVKTNPLLQREIGYWFITQSTMPAAGSNIKGTPVEVLDRLIELLKPDAAETYTVGVYAPPGVGGGHAVTPYAIENVDNNIYHVLVYDNNHPAKTRKLIVDRNKNTWELGLSINPSEQEKPWYGDANTKSFEICPSGPRMVVQQCPFATGTSGFGGAGKNSASKTKYSEIYVDGNGVRLLITDSQGKRYGYAKGVFWQEIPGVTHRYAKSGDSLWQDSPSPVFYVPVGMKFSLTLDGSVVTNLTETAVTFIGPGYDVAVEDIMLDPGQMDTIVFSLDGTGVSYTSGGSESPDITLGFEATGADFEFTVKGVEVDPGATLHLNVDEINGFLTLSSTGNKQPAIYELAIARFDENKAQEFYHDNIELAPADSAKVEYAKWLGDKTSIPLLIDFNNDGSIDRQISLTDEDEPTPRLQAKTLSGGRIQISWSALSENFVLESSTALGIHNWTVITADKISTDGHSNYYIDSVVKGAKFYRLRSY